MSTKKQTKQETKAKFGEYMRRGLKGALISMIFTVAVILLFALIIKETGASDSVIAPINQIIKIAGIITASYFAVKGMAEKQWLIGGLAGTMFIFISYLVFSLIDGMFGNVALLFSDMLMGMLIGMVLALIVANFFEKGRKKRVKPHKTARIKA